MPPVRVFYSARSRCRLDQFPGHPLRSHGIRTNRLLDAARCKSNISIIIRIARQVVPPAPGQSVVQIRVAKPGIRTIVQIAEPEARRPQNPDETHLAALDIFSIYFFEGRSPLRCSRIHPLCGYAATEGGKARQEVPPAPGQSAEQIRAAKPGRRTIAQKAEPEEFSQARVAVSCMYAVTKASR